MVILSSLESDNYIIWLLGGKKKINFTLRFQSGKCIKKCHKLKVPTADRVVVVVVVVGKGGVGKGTAHFLKWGRGQEEPSSCFHGSVSRTILL